MSKWQEIKGINNVGEDDTRLIATESEGSIIVAYTTYIGIKVIDISNAVLSDVSMAEIKKFQDDNAEVIFGVSVDGKDTVVVVDIYDTVLFGQDEPTVDFGVSEYELADLPEEYEDLIGIFSLM